MINKINNSTNFCGSNIIDTVFKMRDLKRAHERELQEIRNAQEEFRAKNNTSCDTFVSTKKENAKKTKNSVSIPAALSAAAILLSLGIKTGLIALDNDGDIELPSSSVLSLNKSLSLPMKLKLLTLQNTARKKFNMQLIPLNQTLI